MFELRGERLTLAGWRRAGNQFFDKPEPFSPIQEIHVVSGKFSLRLDTLTQGPAATVEADFPICEGRIDSELHFHPFDEGVPPGVGVRADCWEIYKLIFDRQDWEVGANGKVTPFTGTVNVEGMRIDGFPRYLVLDRAAAIRYVTAARNKSNDPTVKKNADRTLAALAKMRHDTVLP